MLAWFPLVSQIVVVDSSTDGSLEYLQERLNFSHVEFYSVPTGLYQAWNFAVSLSKSEFCYFSTVGDVISQKGLNHLFELAQMYKLDAVLSPPEMVDACGVPVQTEWPIHALMRHLQHETWFPDRQQIIQLLTSFLPFTILGSSASNLYRTELLTANPFPTEFGHGGDSAFGVKIAPFVKMALTKKTCSCFVTHGQDRDITALEQREVAMNFLKLLDVVFPNAPEGCEQVLAMSCSLLQQKMAMLDWLASLEPLAAVVKEQKGYIDILEGEKSTLLRERGELTRLSAGVPIPFVKTGFLLSLKRFTKNKIKSLGMAK